MEEQPTDSGTRQKKGGKGKWVLAVFVVIVLASAVVYVWQPKSFTAQQLGQLGQQLQEQYTSPTLVLQAAPTGAVVGEKIKVDIMGKSLADVIGVQAALQYNPNVLTYDRAEEGTFMKQGGVGTMFLDVINTTIPGIISDIVVVKLGVPGNNGDGVIASVYFTAKSPGTSSIAFGKVLVGDSNAEIISVNKAETSVVVR